MLLDQIYNCDCVEGMKQLPDASVDLTVTSPPYYGLRDYGVDGQIGVEETPEQYIEKLVSVFREVRRVLKNDGTLWVNIGDSYAGGGGFCETAPSSKTSKSGKYGNTGALIRGGIKPAGDVKQKDLIGIPWMLAFALRADGWYLRQDIIWAKPNPMPESVTDRCTKSHEYIFLFSKSPRYYFDHKAIMEPVAENTVKRMSQDVENQIGSTRVPGKTNGNMKAVGSNERRNKRDVWTVTTKPFKEAHFATFPEDLIEPCILAGCPVNGVVLDPFMGSGTTALTATRLKRLYVGFDLSAEYCAIANKRLERAKAQVAFDI